MRQEPEEHLKAVIEKQRLRRQVLDRRAAHPEKDAASAKIVERLLGLPEFKAAQTVLIYLDVRSEVRTRPALSQLLASDKRVIVPWCEAGSLRLFKLSSVDQLEQGAFGILEPRPELRLVGERQARPAALDLVVVPGVAFDRSGGRLGHGHGYYDRLLAQVRSDAVLVALAFECQMVDCVPMEPHDTPVNLVLTEAATYRTAGSSAR